MQGTAATTNHHRDDQRRRGSVIILAVAVLAVLAISAASYVTITRLDRSSAASYSRQTGFLQQRDAVVGHLRGLVAADFFSNKVVDGSTPRQRAGRDIWPRRFEDGEHWDAPSAMTLVSANRFSFDTRTTEQQKRGDQVSVKARLDWAPDLGVDGMFAPAWPDDAWLASAEPFDLDPAAADDGWDTWPQITNLRSEYRWNDQDQWWERSDGRYVDLANFFRSEEADRLNRGDPGADLTVLDEDALGFAINEVTNVRVMIDQPVYHLQMNHMEEARQTGDYASFDADPFTIEDAPYEQVDTRMWADADGDGRPDSRWQELDALGSSKGLRWLVAARTIDASSMVNANVNIEWGDTGDANSVGAGITPADIDLRRLIETASRDTDAAFGGEPSLRHPDINNLGQSDFAAHFNEHLLRGLNLGALSSDPNADKESALLWEIDNRAISENEDPFRAWTMAFDNRMVDTWATDGGAFEPNNLTNPKYTTRAQRDAYYNFFGSSPNNSPLQFRNGYGWKDNERELRAFWGFNDPSAVTPLEQRFDGPQNNPVSRLPGSTSNPPYPDNGSLGPMRSAEDLDAPRTFDNAADLPGLTGGTYTQRDKVRRIENDARRLLTTYNGSGFVSPQPGWSLNDDGDKLFLGAVPEPLDERGMRRFLSKAMGSFMWALAPLAGDRPVMRAGNAGNPINLAEVIDSRAHYGGWQFGPAAAAEAGTAPGPPGPGTGPGPGPAPTPGAPTGLSGAFVALRTSAALAVNLADAIDDEDDEPTPTIMRVLKNYQVEQTLNGGAVTGRPLPPVAVRGDRLIEVGVDFAHGNLPIGLGGQYSSLDALPADTANVPELWFPSSNDMVVVGLDRQPFLRAVGSLVMYGGLGTIDPPATVPVGVTVEKNQTFGAAWLVAIDIGNPWPTDINLNDYTVVLSDGANAVEIELRGSLGPGENGVFYAEKVEFTVFQTAWDEVINGASGWEDQLPVTPEPPLATPADSLFDLAPGMAPTVLLRREVDGVNVLLDRLTLPDPMGKPFPFGASGDQNFDPTDPGSAPSGIVIDSVDIAAGNRDGEDYLVGFVDGATLFRPTDAPPTTPGFPAYVIERSAENSFAVLDDPDLTRFAVFVGDEGGEDFNTLTVTGPHNENLGDSTGAFPDFTPSFQLFVPDGPLLSPSELLQLCSYAHTYRGVGGTTFGVDDNREAGVSGTASPWTTISEQLGADQALAYNGSMALGTANHNPFFGALDFSRGIIASNDADIALDWSGAGIAPNDVPQELRVPLAVRVLDAFETLGSMGPLAQGRININTAPDRVLRVLPLVDPREGPDYRATYPDLGGWSTTEAAALGRINSLLDYRESRTTYRSPIDGATLNDTPERITQPGMDGLRAPEGTNGQPAQSFVSLGELAILHPWERGTGEPTAPLESGFAEVGFDGPNMNPISGSANVAIDIRPSEFDGDDDLEERLALVRAISAVTSTRSDVFITWFVIRGYSPAAIEAIPVPADADEDEKAELLNQLEPAHESRWLVVLDRSNVRKPTDRPEIILLTQLPPTSP